MNDKRNQNLEGCSEYAYQMERWVADMDCDQGNAPIPRRPAPEYPRGKTTAEQKEEDKE